MVAVDELAVAMYKVLEDHHGKKNLKALDLTKAMIRQYGEEECDKKLCKLAIRALMESGKTTYSYVGGSFVVLNPDYKE